MITKRVKDTLKSSQKYMDWHRSLSRHFHMTDIDSVELTSDGTPRAFIELKPIRKHIKGICPRAYLRSLSEKYVVPGKIGNLFRYLSQRLPKCKFLIICPDFREKEKRFWIYDLAYPDFDWMEYTEEELKSYFALLHEEDISKLSKHESEYYKKRRKYSYDDPDDPRKDGGPLG